LLGCTIKIFKTGFLKFVSSVILLGFFSSDILVVKLAGNVIRAWFWNEDLF